MEDNARASAFFLSLSLYYGIFSVVSVVVVMMMILNSEVMHINYVSVISMFTFVQQTRVCLFPPPSTTGSVVSPMWPFFASKTNTNWTSSLASVVSVCMYHVGARVPTRIYRHIWHTCPIYIYMMRPLVIQL